MDDEDKSLEKLLQALDEQPTTKGRDASVFYDRLEKQSKKTEGSVERENGEILDMRKVWSRWILFFIGLIIVFDMLLVSFYGLGYWNFTDPVVVIAVITDNFLKIFGLGYLITHRLFKKIFT